jgi:hypothetical protein
MGTSETPVVDHSGPSSIGINSPRCCPLPVLYYRYIDIILWSRGATAPSFPQKLILKSPLRSLAIVFFLLCSGDLDCGYGRGLCHGGHPDLQSHWFVRATCHGYELAMVLAIILGLINVIISIVVNITRLKHGPTMLSNAGQGQGQCQH